MHVDLENIEKSRHAQDMYMAATAAFTFSTLYWQLTFLLSLENADT